MVMRTWRLDRQCSLPVSWCKQSILPQIRSREKPSWCTRAAKARIKGFSDLEVAFLTEEIVTESCYLPPGLIQLSPGDVVVDIGANVGVFSQQAADKVGEKGSVLSVEALPPTFRLLQENRDALRRENASQCTWQLVNAAAGDRDSGTRTMTFFPRAAGWGTCMPEQHTTLMKKDLKQFVRNLLEDKTSQVARSALAKFGSFLRRVVPWLFEIVLEVYVRWMASGGRQYDVPSRTVSSLLKEHKLATVQLLKVDVEGAEVQVLHGLDAHAWSHVQQVVVEAHSDALVDTVATILRARFGKVSVEQSLRTRDTQLHMVYATQPLRPAAPVQGLDL